MLLRLLLAVGFCAILLVVQVYPVQAQAPDFGATGRTVHFRVAGRDMPA